MKEELCSSHPCFVVVFVAYVVVKETFGKF